MFIFNGSVLAFSRAFGPIQTDFYRAILQSLSMKE